MNKQYDVIIVGAGIAGLVAGNYISKAGLRVLIAEHHYSVGGCCSSFNRGGFTFDSGAHSLGSCRKGGQFDRVLRELGIIKKIKIKRSEPSDTVITGDLRIDFKGDASQMASDLAAFFPRESKAIRIFFEELDSFDVNQTKSFVSYYSKYKTSLFRHMLDFYFSDHKLKEILCTFLGNLGLASYQIGALPAIAMFKEFVIDGGYYVQGGMQVFVNFLAENFVSYGGTLLLRNKVTKIVV